MNFEWERGGGGEEDGLKVEGRKAGKAERVTRRRGGAEEDGVSVFRCFGASVFREEKEDGGREARILDFEL